MYIARCTSGSKGSKRGYNNEFAASQCTFVQGFGKRKKSRSTFVIDYHPAFRGLYDFLEIHNTMGLSGHFLNVTPEQSMVCFRRSKSLRDHLVRLKFQKVEGLVNGMVKCNSKRCNV